MMAKDWRSAWNLCSNPELKMPPRMSLSATWRRIGLHCEFELPRQHEPIGHRLGCHQVREPGGRLASRLIGRFGRPIHNIAVNGAEHNVVGAHVAELNPVLVRNLTIATGVVLGVLVTLSSVGAGAIGVMALVMLYPKMEARRIVGSDLAHAVPLTLIAGIGHSFLGAIDRHILISLLVGSIPAIVVASIASARMSDTTIRVALALVLLAVVARFWFYH